MGILAAVRLALGTIWGHKLRSGLTLLANIVAVMSVIAVVSILSGMDRYVKEKVVSEGSGIFAVERVDRLKILFWDRDGFCIYYKRLEVGTFPVLTTTSDPEGIEIEYWQLVQLLDGIDLNTGRRRRRYRRSG